MRIIADIVNHAPYSFMLESGIRVGAAHSPEAKLAGVVLTDNDQRRYVRSDAIHVLKQELAPEEKMSEESAQKVPDAAKENGEAFHSQPPSATAEDQQQQPSAGGAKRERSSK